jgi:hypothetical protein
MSTRVLRVLLHVSILLTVILLPVALDCGPRVHSQVPTAADSPKYVLPPKAIVDAFDAEPSPQTLLGPNKQVVALTKARTYPTIAERLGWFDKYVKNAPAKTTPTAQP